MSKLTKKELKDGNEPSDMTGSPSTSFVLRKVENIETDPFALSDAVPKTSNQNVIAPVYPTTPELADVAQWLSQFLEADVVSSLRDNPNLRLPYTEPQITPDEWLVTALKTVFSLDDIEKIGNRIQTKVIQKQETLQAIAAQRQAERALAEQETARMKQRVDQLQAQLDAAEVAKFRLEKALSVSIETKTFIESYFLAAEDAVFRDLLLEAAANPTKDLAQFVARFAQAWAQLRRRLAEPFESEHDRMMAIHKELTALLAQLSGLYILQRRSILDTLARLVSEQFGDYMFISPEESLQVDMNIHNARGLSSSVITEGVSFAVIRKVSRQTIIYADVKVD